MNANWVENDLLKYALEGHGQAASRRVGNVIGHYDAGKMAGYMDVIEFIEHDRDKWQTTEDAPKERYSPRPAYNPWETSLATQSNGSDDGYYIPQEWLDKMGLRLNDKPPSPDVIEPLDSTGMLGTGTSFDYRLTIENKINEIISRLERDGGRG